ncbi:MAG: sulfurtransferase TusA family protein [Syntrophotalea acetylenica]|jgi:TusA-related sulfurtransferase|uniref:Preprotein translocase subunit TatB n=1 Tax=Syntrophotalea acetylenica TaxID=29542 RepID=A0A1L3GH11_SYNAC|nr:sulfurtransferase TusA family protein [Syntrophotalea acetylenica]APG25180.1 preprotein translocase subunit TatB [Syntrophotalea acetylenica]APG43248.1 preprotein translocase subunit TatB [Syntrophotalea acetylenica]MDD4457103.1 sulfurtransferase TusA family protein [Syntrophotalea acetylenica]MDY0261451.1 sulfurtransferase TusA family protein [Syntrophotalea acetylenica]
MTTTIDARGLSCPQPVMLTLAAIKAGEADEIIVLVDNEASRENVCRAAGNRGWTVANLSDQGDETRITLNKG